MNLVRVVFLLAIVGILILSTSYSVSTGTALKSEAISEENETSTPDSLEGLTNGFSETQTILEKIKSCLDRLSASLQSFEFRLVLLSERLHESAKKYTFLQPAVNATNLSIEIVDSIVVDLQSDSDTLSSINSTLDSLNEGIISLDKKITSFNEKVSSINSTFHSNLKHMENLSKKVNSTLEETNITKNITADMNKTVKELGTLFK